MSKVDHQSDMAASPPNFNVDVPLSSLKGMQKMKIDRGRGPYKFTAMDKFRPFWLAWCFSQA
jgi:hypothetical protein